MIRQNQKYIIDLKQTPLYKAANFWFDINGQNTYKFWWQTLNIQIRTPEK